MSARDLWWIDLTDYSFWKTPSRVQTFRNLAAFMSGQAETDALGNYEAEKRSSGRRCFYPSTCRLCLHIWFKFVLFYQDWYQERNDGIGTVLMSTPVDRPLTDFRQRMKPTCSLAEGPVWYQPALSESCTQTGINISHRSVQTWSLKTPRDTTSQIFGVLLWNVTYDLYFISV